MTLEDVFRTVLGRDRDVSSQTCGSSGRVHSRDSFRDVAERLAERYVVDETPVSDARCVYYNVAYKDVQSDGTIFPKPSVNRGEFRSSRFSLFRLNFIKKKKKATLFKLLRFSKDFFSPPLCTIFSICPMLFVIIVTTNQHVFPVLSTRLCFFVPELSSWFLAHEWPRSGVHTPLVRAVHIIHLWLKLVIFRGTWHSLNVAMTKTCTNNRFERGLNELLKILKKMFWANKRLSKV